VESDTSNPAALAWFDTVDETALEATIRPQAIFADVQIQGSITGGPATSVVDTAPVVTTAASGFDFTDPKWIAVLAIAVLAIAAFAVLKEKR